MVEITSVHLVDGEGHEHIGSVRRKNPETEETGESTRQTMVEWIRDQGRRAYVNDGTRAVEVGVVNATTPCIRTHAERGLDGQPSNTPPLLAGRKEIHMPNKKPSKKELSAAGKALRNPRTREKGETKAVKTLAAGRKKKK
jgi:hypothetical protein